MFNLDGLSPQLSWVKTISSYNGHRIVKIQPGYKVIVINISELGHQVKCQFYLISPIQDDDMYNTQKLAL